MTKEFSVTVTKSVFYGYGDGDKNFFYGDGDENFFTVTMTAMRIFYGDGDKKHVSE